MVRVFTAADFEERVINIGDPVVLIQDDHSRVIHTSGSTFVSQGRRYDLGALLLFKKIYFLKPMRMPVFT